MHTSETCTSETQTPYSLVNRDLVQYNKCVPYKTSWRDRIFNYIKYPFVAVISNLLLLLLFRYALRENNLEIAIIENKPHIY